jgi:DNA-binding LytR/AlgR family response regulator
MSALTVLIIEDDIPAQRMLRDMLAELAYDIEVVGCLNSIKSSVAWFENNRHPEIVLLDIELSDGMSFDILKQVNIESMIIFTTAYDEYAIQAFKVNSLDYLVKPFDDDDLLAAFKKYESYSRTFIKHKNMHVDHAAIATTMRGAEVQYRKRFLIQTNEEFLQVPVEEIAYFHSMHKTTFAITFSRIKYPLGLSLGHLTEQLDPDMFFKVNRQLIINIKAIQKIQSYFQGKLVIKATPAHSERIIVGKDKAASFKRWLDR